MLLAPIGEITRRITDRWRGVASRASQPVDGASLAAFRIVFGLTIFWEVCRYVEHGWIERYYIEPSFHFKYWPFDFVQPWSGTGMYWHFAALGIAALGVALGIRYRLCAVAQFLLLAYMFLLDQALYLNHMYLATLMAFVLVFLPADRVGSLRRRPQAEAPSTVPAWTVWLLRFQVGIPYVFGGIAKLNTDWLAGEPLRGWLAARTDFPVIGGAFGHTGTATLMAYGSLVLDLTAPVLLLFRRTRLAAFTLLALFHLVNSGLFRIGIFPWLMMGATMIFFSADWPRRLWRDLRRQRTPALHGVLAGGGIGFVLGATIPSTDSPVHAVTAALIGAIIGYHAASAKTAAKPARPAAPGPTAAPVPIPALVWVWVAVQVLVPLRHFAYPGSVHWTEEGHLYSWHMKLRQKNGRVTFRVVNRETGEQSTVDPADELTDKQTRKMAGRPDLIVQYAHHLAEVLEDEHAAAFSVYADSRCRLNRRRRAPLIDPDADLAHVSRPWMPPGDFIAPLPARRGESP